MNLKDTWLQKLVDVIRLKHYSLDTERTYKLIAAPVQRIA